MRSFFRELRKRHVVKVGAAYLVAAWGILQFGDVIFAPLNLPEDFMRWTLLALAAGFPVVLLLAWIFDITPKGIRRTDTLDQEQAAARDAANAAAAFAVAGQTTPGGNTQVRTGTRKSIAVLPFSDLSPEGDQEYFCDGLSEELLNVFACIPHLRVASRTSCFAFKGKNRNLADIAEKLDVTYIMEGSVRKSGSKIRISAQLIDVAQDTQLWSASYDRELTDIFDIQDDIATRILNALEVTLGDTRLLAATTENARAYEYFLRGRGHLITNTSKGLRRASELFRQAVELDEAFVRAWVALAEVGSIEALFLGGGERSRALSEEAATRAMALAPDNAGSYFARGLCNLGSEHYEKADADFERALELDPNLNSANYYLARSAFHMGDLEKAKKYFRISTENDPDDFVSPILMISIYEKENDEGACLECARVAVERIEKHLKDYPDNPRAYYLGVGAQYLLGNVDKANEWAERALELTPNDPPTAYNLACFYSRIGETDKALDLLEHSITSKSWMTNDPDLDNIRHEPRFIALLERLED